MTSKAKFKQVCLNFLRVFGLLWLFIEPTVIFLEFKKDSGTTIYIFMLVLSILISLFLSRRRTSLTKEINNKRSKISILVGDLFNQETHIVIGTNDVFDTELGDVIKPNSIQGQFTTSEYNSDAKKLDVDIQKCLTEKALVGKADACKKRGKNIRFPVGTTITLGASHKSYLSAYSKMSKDLKAQSSSDLLWHSMNKLWDEVRLTGQAEPISIPIIGSELARTGLSRNALVQMIILSFASANVTGYVSKQLNIVIHNSDVHKMDFIVLEQFLNSIDI